MSKKKKIILSVILTIFLVIIVSVVSLYLYFKPYIRVINVVKELMEEDYSYEIECYIEGMTLGEGEYGEYIVYVEGEKYDDSLRSYIYSEENAYLEVFANTDGEVIFNIRPLFQFISNQIEAALDISVGEVVLDIEDTYISMEDIEQILDVDIVGPDDFSSKDEAASDNKDEQEDDNTSKKDKYKLDRIDCPDDINVDYDAENSCFFQLTLLESGTKVIVGVPTNDAEDIFYVNMEKDDIRLEMYAEYDVEDADVEEINFPNSTFTEEQLENFKAVYKMWLAGKEVLDKLK